jgi:predicted hydrolase (HD superfamily)
MISRDDALKLLHSGNPEPHLLAHALESEAVLRGLARNLGRDEELWGLTGLLHDLDYAASADQPSRHGLASREQLRGLLPEEALAAIARHAYEMNGAEPPSTELDFALRCGETVTGLVHANALVRPGGLNGMEPKSLKKKMKEKAFAASVNRDTIRECEKIGLDLNAFFQIAINAVSGIKVQVGLG